MTKIQLSLVLATVFGVSTTAPALAGSMYTITDLGKLIPDGTDTRAASINNQGQIVGRSRTAGNTASSGYIWENGTITALPLTGPVNGGAVVTLPGRGGLSRSINDAGIIVGAGDETAGPTDRALLWTPNGSGGYDLNIYNFGGLESYFIDINNSNQIAGYDIFEANRRNAIFWENGIRTDLPSLNGDQNFGLAINDNTEIVGYVDSDGAINGTNVYSAAFWEQDANGNFVLTNLGIPNGFAQSFARDINQDGLVIGQATNGSGSTLTSSGFLWDNGNLIDLGSLGGTRGDALSVNQAGQIVGFSNIASEVAHATLWQNGQLSDLNDLLVNGTGWVLNQATGINERGQIIGFGTFTNELGQQETRAFLLESVPEPSAIMGLLAVGIFGFTQLRTLKK
jgi:probable HAF family extracellular repeat protein